MNRPHVTLKLATSLDGRIATVAGESRWITGEAARAEVHKMRAGVDAVMIGAGTARVDNPSLLARTDLQPARQPKRVVLSRSFDVPVSGRLFEHLEESPLIVIGEDPNARSSALELAGARVGYVIDMASEGPELALAFLHSNLDICSVLAEGGGVLSAALIKAGLVDRIEWFRAPMLLGAEGRPAIGGLALAALAEAPKWRRVAVRELGPDLWESYERA
jgi:diaminohydroxyphosphoribosylaminopyrimidine deaminase / 5-amino-6-(5-phosphoribosylamino)uracil reductase